VRLYIDPDGDSPIELHPIQIDLTTSIGRQCWLSPDHPNLYGVAKEAEGNGDKTLMRAVVAAALVEDTPRDG
jgi:hypothetical protein